MAEPTLERRGKSAIFGKPRDEREIGFAMTSWQIGFVVSIARAVKMKNKRAGKRTSYREEEDER